MVQRLLIHIELLLIYILLKVINIYINYEYMRYYLYQYPFPLTFYKGLLFIKKFI